MGATWRFLFNCNGRVGTLFLQISSYSPSSIRCATTSPCGRITLLALPPNIGMLDMEDVGPTGQLMGSVQEKYTPKGLYYLSFLLFLFGSEEKQIGIGSTAPRMFISNVQDQFRGGGYLPHYYMRKVISVQWQGYVPLGLWIRYSLGVLCGMWTLEANVRPNFHLARHAILVPPGRV